MNNGTEKFIKTVGYLSGLYDFCNKKLFGGELEKPIITVQQDARNKASGWWSIKKVWHENTDDDGEHELNITAQSLSRPIGQIAATLLHEMCHQYATANNIQDCSRGNTYHNKLFKRIAETHGLIVECVPTIGWSKTDLTKDTETLIADFVKDNPESLIFREPTEKGQIVKSSNTRKYECPACGQSVRATKKVNIICADCSCVMVER